MPEAEDADTGEEEVVESTEAETTEEEVEAEEGDETEAEESADEESTEEEKPPTRGETRQQRLANEAREARERAIALEAENKALRETRAAAPAPSYEAERIRAEKLAVMTPEEKEIFLLKEQNQRLEQGQQLTQIQIADIADRTAYDTRASTNPVYQKHKDWVENALMQARKSGQNPTREALLRWKIGEDALSAKPTKKMQKAKADAAVRTANAKGQPMSARGDASGKSDKDDDSMESLRQRIVAQEKRAGLR